MYLSIVYFNRPLDCVTIGNIKTDICHRSLKNNDTDHSIDAWFQCDHFVKLE